jgi:hypothetical protein
MCKIEKLSYMFFFFCSRHLVTGPTFIQRQQHPRPRDVLNPSPQKQKKKITLSTYSYPFIPRMMEVDGNWRLGQKIITR